jgi:hypothetical protein
MHRQIFRPITTATTAFSTNQFQLIPSTRLLCRLTVGPQTRNNNIELHIDDLRIYDTLDGASKKLEAAMKLFTRGKSKAAQEAEAAADSEND